MRARRNKFRAIVLLIGLAAALGQSVFRSGTRLVEVDVVVRDKNGPVTGLTKDDFALYDCKWSERDQYNGFEPCRVKRQPLEVFHEISSAVPPQISGGTAPAMILKPGAVSNRLSSDGSPAASPTIVLIDLLNTPFNLKSYERDQIVKFLKSIGDKNRVALYSLGRKLHVLQDFTGDPKNLIQALAKLDIAEIGPPGKSFDDPAFAVLENQVFQDRKDAVTMDAMKTIIQHVAGVPGRKNLVWIAQGFNPKVRTLLGQANIAVYPVMTHFLTVPSMIGTDRLPSPHAMSDVLAGEANRKFGQSFGGSFFGDAEDALQAVRAAEEDSGNYYVLGFYPAEKDLDGKKHELTLDVSKRVRARRDLAVQYRQEYLASKSGSASPDDRPSIESLFASPLNATSIGLAANIVADPAKPEASQIQIEVNLADLQLRREEGRAVGSFQMTVRFEREVDGVLKATDPIVRTVPVNFAAEKMQDYGLVTQPIPPGMKPSTAHIVVQDGSNGAAGSLRVPIPN
jgi:VWFA-related protein